MASLFQILEGTAFLCVLIFLIVRLRGQRDENRKTALLKNFLPALLVENSKAWKTAVVSYLDTYRGWHTPLEIATFFGVKDKILDEAIEKTNSPLFSAIHALIEKGVLKVREKTESAVLWDIALVRKRRGGNNKKIPPG